MTTYLVPDATHQAATQLRELTYGGELLSNGNPLPIATPNGNANGQATMANSQPVVLPSNQSAIPVTRSAAAVYSLASTTTVGATQNSGDLTVGLYTEIALDINVTAQAGTNPTLQFFYERKGADGIYYVLWQTTSLTAATQVYTVSIGAGMNYAESLGSTGRLRWVVGGTATPTFTFSVNITGK